MNTTTPVIISKQIRDLCEKIDPEYKLFSLPQNVSKLTVLPVQELMDIMSIS